ncbi:dTDP-4-dehydrorhamnose 3,5-epimerase [Bradyrhizobium sp. CW11]|uniref:dTDP-4-dehydrorhamnose 3,5-epimerase n=1 Tax=Bradyrhizobium sp. CW11 TaxID=2782684 RepID=UPI001FF830C7|nr:dTDP-4-dehydrorhamnose 3,5-epimerase [Bradyrhizobium sp. CW11]MCK1342253.1 dTDP-4-dehydrorhamnose 3,5-epimerase [Bradyrhizobium sp. CW11]
MKLEQTDIAGVWVTESTAHQDDRGTFSRLFCSREQERIIGSRSIVQINYSITSRVGALRGLHYQNPPYAEMKIVRCLKGRVFDVAVDLRKGSPTFRRWTSLELTPASRRALLIPEGCAHGFQVLEPDSELLYLHTAPYVSKSESAIRFDDPMIGIDWPLSPLDLSERDLHHPLLDSSFEGLVI